MKQTQLLRKTTYNNGPHIAHTYIFGESSYHILKYNKVRQFN